MIRCGITFVIGLLLGLLAGLSIANRHAAELREKVTMLNEQLDASESTVDDLGQKNLDRWHRNQEAFIEIKRLRDTGADVDAIIEIARDSLFEAQHD